VGTEDCARCGRQVVLLNQALVGGVGGAVAGVTRRRSVLVGYKFQTYDQNTESPIKKSFLHQRWEGGMASSTLLAVESGNNGLAVYRRCSDQWVDIAGWPGSHRATCSELRAKISTELRVNKDVQQKDRILAGDVSFSCVPSTQNTNPCGPCDLLCRPREHRRSRRGLTREETAPKSVPLESTRNSSVHDTNLIDEREYGSSILQH